MAGTLRPEPAKGPRIVNRFAVHPRTWLAGIDKRWILRAAVFAAAAAAFLPVIGRQVNSRRHAGACRANLETIYRALVAADRDANLLPRIALYPDDVRKDEDSLLARLAAYGITSSDCICPAAGPVLQETGITYIWNTELIGKKIADLSPPRWMLADMRALDPHLPGVHNGYNLVLYSDGRIERSKRPPPLP